MTLRKTVAILLLCSTSLCYAQDEKTFFLISNTHLDTQWNWDVRTTIKEYVKNTLVDNMALMDKYPSFRLNYEGAIKYMWMKEYYPQEFEQLKQYVQSGQWHVSGMSIDASDVMMSSAESILHSMLYANRFYMKEFGVRGGYDVMLPDCFGFSYALPSLMRHAGQKGFHSCLHRKECGLREEDHYSPRRSVLFRGKSSHHHRRKDKCCPAHHPLE